MKSRYLDNGETIKKINITILISLVPLMIFGFYKNGIKLYLNDLVNIIGMFKPIIFDILGIFIGLLSSYIYDRFIIKKSIHFFKDSLNNFYPLYGLLIASIISINTSYLLFIITTFVILFVSKFFKKSSINVVALSFLIILFIMDKTNGFTFLNIYENKGVLHLEPIDYFLGKGSGGVNTTCSLLLIISIIILSRIKYYKKEIAIFSICTYIICIFIYSLYRADIKLLLESIFSNGILFNFIYVAPLSMFSPLTNKGKIIYSILLGIITFILSLIEPNFASIGAIFILSLSCYPIDKLVQR